MRMKVEGRRETADFYVFDPVVADKTANGLR
jgi:hypothetical protein